MDAVLGLGHAIADLKHVGVVPVAGARVLAQRVILVGNAHDSPGGPFAVVGVLAVKAALNAPCAAPELPAVFGPFPGFAASPSAHAEYHRPPRRKKGLAHGQVGALLVEAVRV